VRFRCRPTAVASRCRQLEACRVGRSEGVGQVWRALVVVAAAAAAAAAVVVVVVVVVVVLLLLLMLLLHPI
jgi:hypothetical protein